jgi:hypothetical protein
MTDYRKWDKMAAMLDDDGSDDEVCPTFPIKICIEDASASTLRSGTRRRARGVACGVLLVGAEGPREASHVLTSRASGCGAGAAAARVFEQQTRAGSCDPHGPSQHCHHRTGQLGNIWSLHAHTHGSPCKRARNRHSL